LRFSNTGSIPAADASGFEEGWMACADQLAELAEEKTTVEG
jgi:hypothetical protein